MPAHFYRRGDAFACAECLPVPLLFAPEGALFAAEAEPFLWDDGAAGVCAEDFDEPDLRAGDLGSACACAEDFDDAEREDFCADGAASASRRPLRVACGTLDGSAT